MRREDPREWECVVLTSARPGNSMHISLDISHKNCRDTVKITRMTGIKITALVSGMALSNAIHHFLIHPHSLSDVGIIHPILQLRGKEPHRIE